MLHREDTRIIGEAKLGKNLESPEGITSDGKTRSTVAADYGPGAILKQLFRLPRVFAKFVPCHLIYDAMPQTVAGYLVATLGNKPNDVWLSFSDPAQRKKCVLATGVVEEIEKKVRVALDAAQLGIPLVGRNAVPKGSHMIVILQINCESVLHVPFHDTSCS
jgi:hypothetical protein